jgi:DNA polymerase-3 subunit gamma/tau
MSYLVLARKYRPQTFEDIVGQEHVTRTLQNAIRQGRLHHAFLFTGARGVGKTTAARILAKALSCVNAPTPTPCNVCDACREITSGTSVDVQEIDAASNNGVDNIRELREGIRYAPVRGKKKVYILDEVHMLSGGAWNALLKTLEEPPPHALFIFATTDPHKLPATILSRVQRYDFKLVPTKRIVEHVGRILDEEKISYEPAALALLARESGGSVRDSLSLVDQIIAALDGESLTESAAAGILGVADRALLAALGHAVLARDPSAALTLVDGAFTRGSDMTQLAQAFLGQLRDLLVAQVVADPSPLIEGAAGDLAALQAEAKAAPAGLLEHLFTRFAVRVDEIAKSPLPRAVLEVALVELCRLQPIEAVGPLIAKLEALETRIGRGGSPGPSGGRPKAEPKAAPQPAAPPPAKAEPSPPPVAPPVAKSPPPANFTALVEALMTHDALLSPLAQARLLKQDDKVLSLGFDKSFPADQIRDRMESLRRGLKNILDRELAVEIIVGPSGAAMPGTESLIEVEEQKASDERAQRRNEALTHPLRRSIDETFGGSWQEPVLDGDKT